MKLDLKSLIIGAIAATFVLLVSGFNTAEKQPYTKIWTDSTDVQYIVYSDGRGGLGITPRYLHDGSFVLGGVLGR